MDLSREKEIETKILKLAQVILRVEATNLSNSYIQNLCRYLKYQSSQSSSNLHQHAIKIRLREQILSNYSPTYASSTALMTEKTQDGVINVTKFDEEVDNLRKKSSRYLNSFLVIFQAICFKNPFNSHSKYFPLVSNQQEKKSTQPPSEPSLSTASANLHLGTTTLPIGIPPRLNEDEVTLLNDHTLWISKDVEYLILRDLLLIFQGINGVHIKLDDRSQAYIIDPDIIVPPPARDVVLCLCELGWLYGRVAQYLKILERDDTRGLIAQAFGHTLQVYLFTDSIILFLSTHLMITFVS